MKSYGLDQQTQNNKTEDPSASHLPTSQPPRTSYYWFSHLSTVRAWNHCCLLQRKTMVGLLNHQTGSSQSPKLSFFTPPQKKITKFLPIVFSRWSSDVLTKGQNSMVVNACELNLGCFSSLNPAKRTPPTRFL